MLEVVSKISISGVASTYVGYVRNKKNNLIEFVDSTPSPQSDRRRKWVIIVSSQIGCRLNCRFCDASEYFKGNLTRDEIISQVDYVVNMNSFNPCRTEKFKIQFARMGEPSLNNAVLDAMTELQKRFPHYIPCIATTAPKGSEQYFERLLRIKDIFSDFQLQFSVNSADESQRDEIMPFRKQPLEWISAYSERFYQRGKRKIVLNFALSPDARINYGRLAKLFNPKINIIKLTPVNPTRKAEKNGFETFLDYNSIYSYLKHHSYRLSEYGFQSIISIGDMRENTVLSNCGQIANILAVSS
ncbi:MAG: radical SAM protein [Deltaproteobacteria bacterium]|nr:radical SAM protein [Deltaproteobacteria bacterium]